MVRVCVTGKELTVSVIAGTRTSILGIDVVTLKGLSGFEIKKRREGKTDWEYISSRNVLEKEIRSSMEGLENIELTHFKDEIYEMRKSKLLEKLSEIGGTLATKYLRVADIREMLIAHKIRSLEGNNTEKEEEEDISTKMSSLRLDQDNEILRKGMQRFRYTDNNIVPGAKYEYEISPIYIEHVSSNNKYTITFIRSESVRVRFCSELENSDQHEMYFNRGTAGHQFISKTYLTKQERSTNTTLKKREDHPIWQWLGRGLDKSLVNFLDKAKEGETLMIALYECAYYDILEKLRELRQDRGVRVRILVHGKMNWSSNVRSFFHDSGSSAKNIASLVHMNLFPHDDTLLRKIAGQSHNKMFLHLDKEQKPKAMWIGSANMSSSAFFGQFNLGHIVHDSGVLLHYYKTYWENLCENTLKGERDFNELKQRNKKLPQPHDITKYTKLTCALCPQNNLDWLNYFGDLIRNAKQAVFLTVPFWLHDVIGNACLKIPRNTKWPNAVPCCFAHNEPCILARSKTTGRVYFRCRRADGCRYSAYVPNTKYCSRCKKSTLKLSEKECGEYVYHCETCEYKETLCGNSLTHHDVPIYILADSMSYNNNNPTNLYLGLVQSLLHGQVAIGTHFNNTDDETITSERLTGYSTHVKYVHTKFLIVDPFDEENCCVVTGSGNFSKASLEKNDDNYMIIRQNRRVCDVYLTEFMRVFDHFRVRDRATKSSAYNATKSAFESKVDSSEFLTKNKGYCVESDDWTRYYVEGSGPLWKERKLFGYVSSCGCCVDDEGEVYGSGGGGDGTCAS